MKRKHLGAAIAALLAAILLLVLVIIMTGCSGGSEESIDENSPKHMKWLMVPKGDVYFVRDGNEPADNYNDIWYDGYSKLYYIRWKNDKITYITPEGNPVEMTGEYEYLKDYPIPVQGVDENRQYYYHYIYADGTEVFPQRFRFACPFQGDYAVVTNGDERQGVINKEGMPIYSAKFVNEELAQLDGSIFAEKRQKDCVIVDVLTGETLHEFKNTEFYNRFNKGYIFTDRKTQKCYLTDKNFQPMWKGKTFDMIWPITKYKDKTLRFMAYDGESRSVLDEEGKEILKLKSYEEQSVLPGDERILVYDKGRIICYDYDGKEVYTKEFTKDFDPTDIMDGGYACGMAAITLDGENYGIVDKDGKMLTDFSYNDAAAFSNGTVLVAYNRKAGILGL